MSENSDTSTERPPRRLLASGLLGIGVTVLCCFTPLLVWILPALGLAGIMVWLDAVLLPLLGFFVLLTGVALWRRMRT